MYNFFYTQQAFDDFKGLPSAVKKRVAQKMRFYAQQDNPLKFAKRLTNYDEGQFRFRIGDYRVFFDVIKDRIYILKISHRSKAY